MSDIDFKSILPKWISDNTTVHTFKDYKRLDIPLLNDVNDFSSIYIIEKDNKIILSDGGESFGESSLYGYKTLSEETLKDAIENISNSLGICFSRETNELTIETTENNFYWDFGQMALAMQRAFAIPNIARALPCKTKEQSVSKTFKTALIKSQCAYEQKKIIAGETLPHVFDYMISTQERNKLIKLMPEDTIEAKEALLFEWIDLGCEFENGPLYVVGKTHTQKRTSVHPSLDKEIKKRNIVTFTVDKDLAAINRYIFEVAG